MSAMMKPAPMQPICQFLFTGGAGIGSRSRSIELTVIVGASAPFIGRSAATVAPGSGVRNGLWARPFAVATFFG